MDKFRLVCQEDINLDTTFYMRKRDYGYEPFNIHDIIYNNLSSRQDKIEEFILACNIPDFFYNEKIKGDYPFLVRIYVNISLFFDMVYVKE